MIGARIRIVGGDIMDLLDIRRVANASYPVFSGGSAVFVFTDYTTQRLEVRTYGVSSVNANTSYLMANLSVVRLTP